MVNLERQLSRRAFIKTAGIVSASSLLVGPMASLAHTEQLSTLPNRESVDKHILDNASKNQIVIFGEHHAESMDEGYFVTLLPRLKKLGFQYLALEMDEGLTQVLQEYVDDKRTFKNLVDFLQQYSCDRPTGSFEAFGSLRFLLVEAKKLKLKVVAFDDTDYRDKPSNLTYTGTYREHKMFENLKKHVFNKYPKEKMIIYAGAAHATKYPFMHPKTKKKELMLGNYLNTFTNGHMYSVNLTPYDNQLRLDYYPFINQ